MDEAKSEEVSKVKWGAFGLEGVAVRSQRSQEIVQPSLSVRTLTFLFLKMKRYDMKVYIYRKKIIT